MVVSLILPSFVLQYVPLFDTYIIYSVINGAIFMYLGPVEYTGISSFSFSVNKYLILYGNFLFELG